MFFVLGLDVIGIEERDEFLVIGSFLVEVNEIFVYEIIFFFVNILVS